MIISAIIYLASFIVNLVLVVFPFSSGLPLGYHQSLTTFSGYVGIFDPLVPISTLLDALTIVLFYEITIFSFKALSWVYKKIPFLGK